MIFLLAFLLHNNHCEFTSHMHKFKYAEKTGIKCKIFGIQI